MSSSRGLGRALPHGHGGPHNRVLDEAGDYFRDTYRGHMVQLVGLRPVKMAWDSVIQAEVPRGSVS
jgi:hypothetical protein